MKTKILLLAFFVCVFASTVCGDRPDPRMRKVMADAGILDFEYKILTAEEAGMLFAQAAGAADGRESIKNDNSYYVFGRVKLYAPLPSALVRITVTDRKIKSFERTITINWLGPSQYNFFLTRLWPSETKPEIEFAYEIKMGK